MVVVVCHSGLLFHRNEIFHFFAFSLELLNRLGPDFDRIIREVYYTWPPENSDARWVLFAIAAFGHRFLLQPSGCPCTPPVPTSGVLHEGLRPQYKHYFLKNSGKVTPIKLKYPTGESSCQGSHSLLQCPF